MPGSVSLHVGARLKFPVQVILFKFAKLLNVAGLNVDEMKPL